MLDFTEKNQDSVGHSYLEFDAWNLGFQRYRQRLKNRSSNEDGLGIFSTDERGTDGSELTEYWLWKYGGR